MKSLVNLEKLRKGAGLTRGKLAAKLGMQSAQQIYNIERGRAPLPPKYITKYAKLLEIRETDLFDYCIEWKRKILRRHRVQK